jgi:hypothetical protein
MLEGQSSRDGQHMDAEVSALYACMRELEGLTGSAWALDLSDKPPLGYTA